MHTPFDQGHSADLKDTDVIHAARGDEGKADLNTGLSTTGRGIVRSLELVIPSYNRLPILRTTLEKIRLLYPDLNICLGFQGEMPDNEFQSRLAGDPLVRIERFPLPSVPRTMNRCVESSEADIVLFLDDDAVPLFGWLEAHADAFAQDPDLAYTAGREIRATKGTPAFSQSVRILAEFCAGIFLDRNKKLNGRIVGWINRFGFMFGNFDQPGICRINSPRGCNMAVRRDFFMKIGGFNNSFRGNAWGFEADFGLRAARQGRYGQYRGDAMVLHYETAMGGTRAAQATQWFQDFLHNHTVLIRNLGPQAWLGSLPRLLKKRFFTSGSR
jgi:hypothetical protein